MPEPDRNLPILVVDDEPDMCWALEHILGKYGFVTQKALSGQEALDLLQKQRFRLVFLDAKLPDVDGLELSRRMRALYPEISIVMVSGYFYRDDIIIQKALSLGLIRGFISKPFLQEEILNATQS
jgi:CheY-like chemotaxis protein